MKTRLATVFLLLILCVGISIAKNEFRVRINGECFYGDKGQMERSEDGRLMRGDSIRLRNTRGYEEEVDLRFGYDSDGEMTQSDWKGSLFWLGNSTRYVFNGGNVIWDEKRTGLYQCDLKQDRDGDLFNNNFDSDRHSGDCEGEGTGGFDFMWDDDEDDDNANLHCDEPLSCLVDSDGDGIVNCRDKCPTDKNKVYPGRCGCGKVDLPDGISCEWKDRCVKLCGDRDRDRDRDRDDDDSDRDNTRCPYSFCPYVIKKDHPGVCGWCELDMDSDGDGVMDCKDGCPKNKNRIEPGICGCDEWKPDVDTDGDGVYDCNGDVCPNDPFKSFDAGICGCGVPDVDKDGDKVPDCIDVCPKNPTKSTHVGICGCDYTLEEEKIDTDRDGVVDCQDRCPLNDKLVNPDPIYLCSSAPSASFSSSRLHSPSVSSQASFSPTPSLSQSSTSAASFSVTSKASSSSTPSSSVSSSSKASESATSCPSESVTSLSSVSSTKSSSVSNTATTSPSVTPTGTTTPSSSPSRTSDASSSPTSIASVSSTMSSTWTLSGTPIPTPSLTPRVSPSSEPSSSNAITPSSTNSETSRPSLSATSVPSESSTSQASSSVTSFPSGSITSYPSGSTTPSGSKSPSSSPTGLSSTSRTSQASGSPTPTISSSVTSLPTTSTTSQPSLSRTPSLSPSATISQSSTPSLCDVPSMTPSPSRVRCPSGSVNDFPGECGCFVKEIDSDRDGVKDCKDACPFNPYKWISPGICGCETLVDVDSDKDGYYDCMDGCPFDPYKIQPGLCGCGKDDSSDRDRDGYVDCIDFCADDPLKWKDGGICGCGVLDTIDSDRDGFADCIDLCPLDPLKIHPGGCGCHRTETGDQDKDGFDDCVDACPLDPKKWKSRGVCGCGVDDTKDSDHDGIPDCIDTFNECEKYEKGLLDGDHDGYYDCGVGIFENQKDCVEIPLQCSYLLVDHQPISTNNNNVDSQRVVIIPIPLLCCKDHCPKNPSLQNQTLCGCCPLTGDRDHDGILDCVDPCPDSHLPHETGLCPCGVDDSIDTDHDRVPNCADLCPDDPFQSLTKDPFCGCNRIRMDNGNGNEPPVCSCDIFFDPDGILEFVIFREEGNPNDSIRLSMNLHSYQQSVFFIDGFWDLQENQPEWGSFTYKKRQVLPLQETITLDTNHVPWTLLWNFNKTTSSIVYNQDVNIEKVCPPPVCRFPQSICSCYYEDVDSDGDGIVDCKDLCPLDSRRWNSTNIGCGCGFQSHVDPDAERDFDGDGVLNCDDICPYNAAITTSFLTRPGYEKEPICKCNLYYPDDNKDSDGDGVPDCMDLCPFDEKQSTSVNFCGCNQEWKDSDQDGVADCFDLCPSDPYKITPGICGCFHPDIDTDHDGVMDCEDECPGIPTKTKRGICGCTLPDVDTDGDGVYDCHDECPFNPTLIRRGFCGCRKSSTLQCCACETIDSVLFFFDPSVYIIRDLIESEILSQPEEYSFTIHAFGSIWPSFYDDLSMEETHSIRFWPLNDNDNDNGFIRLDIVLLHRKTGTQIKVMEEDLQNPYLFRCPSNSGGDDDNDNLSPRLYSKWGQSLTFVSRDEKTIGNGCEYVDNDCHYHVNVILGSVDDTDKTTIVKDILLDHLVYQVESHLLSDSLERNSQDGFWSMWTTGETTLQPLFTEISLDRGLSNTQYTEQMIKKHVFSKDDSTMDWIDYLDWIHAQSTSVRNQVTVLFLFAPPKNETLLRTQLDSHPLLQNPQRRIIPVLWSRTTVEDSSASHKMLHYVPLIQKIAGSGFAQRDYFLDIQDEYSNELTQRLLCCDSELDSCGVCFGKNDTCLDCRGVVNGNVFYDHCGVCGGDSTSCDIPLCNSNSTLQIHHTIHVEVHPCEEDQIGWMVSIEDDICDSCVAVIHFEDDDNDDDTDTDCFIYNDLTPLDYPYYNNIPSSNTPREYCDTVWPVGGLARHYPHSVDQWNVFYQNTTNNGNARVYQAKFSFSDLRQVLSLESTNETSSIWNGSVRVSIYKRPNDAFCLHGGQSCMSHDHRLTSTVHPFTIQKNIRGDLQSDASITVIRNHDNNCGADYCISPSLVRVEETSSVWLKGGDVQIRFQTTFNATNLPLLISPQLYLPEMLLEGQTGIPFFLVEDNNNNSALISSCQITRICKQTWTIRTMGASGVVTFTGTKPIRFKLLHDESHGERELAGYHTVFLQVDLHKSQDRQYIETSARTTLSLYSDSSLATTLLQSKTMVEGETVYGQIRYHPKNILSVDDYYAMKINQISICVADPLSPVSSLVPYSSADPLHTGCQTKGAIVKKYPLYRYPDQSYLDFQFYYPWKKTSRLYDPRSVYFQFKATPLSSNGGIQIVQVEWYIETPGSSSSASLFTLESNFLSHPVEYLPHNQNGIYELKSPVYSHAYFPHKLISSFENDRHQTYPWNDHSDDDNQHILHPKPCGFNNDANDDDDDQCSFHDYHVTNNHLFVLCGNHRYFNTTLQCCQPNIDIDDDNSGFIHSDDHHHDPFNNQYHSTDDIFYWIDTESIIALVVFILGIMLSYFVILCLIRYCCNTSTGGLSCYFKPATAKTTTTSTTYVFSPNKKPTKTVSIEKLRNPQKPAIYNK